MDADAMADPTLYTGSARFYPVGRMPYPSGLADAVRERCGLDGSGRLLDVGCGPGPLALPLAGLFASAVGIDADPPAGLFAERLREVELVLWRP